MSIKDNPVVILGSIAVASFMLGWGAPKAIEMKAGLTTVNLDNYILKDGQEALPPNAILDPAPLEGEWKYELIFSKFHNEDVPHESRGLAYLAWNGETNHYDIYKGYEIREDWNTTTPPKVVAFAQGTLESDSTGLPQRGSSFEMSYTYRLGSSGYENTSNSAYKFENVQFKKDNDGHIQGISATYTGKKSTGNVRFYRK